MHLVQFLKEIDTSVAEMPKEQLEAFIHALARVLPKKDRNQFLNALLTIKSNNTQDTLALDTGLDNLNSEISEITLKLNSINDENQRLDSEYNEKYNHDWYNSDVEEFKFSDPKKLLPCIEKGIDLIHKCIDMEEYHLGYELVELLTTLRISVNGDYSDYGRTPMRIKELYYHNLLDISFDQFTLELINLL